MFAWPTGRAIFLQGRGRSEGPTPGGFSPSPPPAAPRLPRAAAGTELRLQINAIGRYDGEDDARAVLECSQRAVTVRGRGGGDLREHSSADVCAEPALPALGEGDGVVEHKVARAACSGTHLEPFRRRDAHGSQRASRGRLRRPARHAAPPRARPRSSRPGAVHLALPPCPPAVSCTRPHGAGSAAQPRVLLLVVIAPFGTTTDRSHTHPRRLAGRGSVSLSVPSTSFLVSSCCLPAT